MLLHLIPDYFSTSSLFPLRPPLMWGVSEVTINRLREKLKEMEQDQEGKMAVGISLAF